MPESLVLAFLHSKSEKKMPEPLVLAFLIFAFCTAFILLNNSYNQSYKVNLANQIRSDQLI